MTRPDDRLPDRMRTYRVEAELRESPDLHKLAQLFIGMARARAEQDHTRPASPSSQRHGSTSVSGDEVE